MSHPYGSPFGGGSPPPPPPPPYPNHVPPDSSRLPHPQWTNPVPNASNPQSYYYAGPNTSFGPPPNPYIPHGHGPPAPPTNKPFSFRSALGQFAKTALFGLPQAGSAPFNTMPHQPSYGSSVTVNGVQLGQGDLMNLQALVGPVLPGAYWYDRRCGAYGLMGGPCRGFITAGLALGSGQLAHNASGNTGTRVFINGREIHATDVIGLQGMGVTVMQGNWWLNADGSYGSEGNPISWGNLRLQASAAVGGGGGGGAHTWSTRMGHYGGSDGKGFMYVGGPGWSWSN